MIIRSNPLLTPAVQDPALRQVTQDLDGPDAQVFQAERSLLLKFQNLYAASWTSATGAAGCTNHGGCDAVRLAARDICRTLLDPFRRIDEQILTKLCTLCRSKALSDSDAGILRMWSRIPEVVGLADWKAVNSLDDSEVSVVSPLVIPSCAYFVPSASPGVRCPKTSSLTDSRPL